MILHWNALVRYFGTEVNAHQHRFQQAGQTTYGLLCCRFAPGNDRLGTSSGDHAEQRLLRSPLWTDEIPAALNAWTSLNRSPIVVTLAINRSPCPMCTDELVNALTALQWEFPMRFPQARFILASRGAYQGQVTSAGYYANATTMAGLRRLHNAGWELGVLQTGTQLSPSGEQLRQALERIYNRTGILHLPS